MRFRQTFNFIIPILILLIAPLLTLMWHSANTQMPMSDAMDYIEPSYTMFDHFKNSNFFEFLVSIFNERGWRPIIFPVFIMPFMIITDGSIMLSTLLTHLLFTSLSAYFIYKIFRIFSNQFTSAISSSILCLSNNIFFGGEPFPLFAEISFIPFFLATIYYLAHEKIFVCKKVTFLFSLFFCLSIMTRPIEGILHLLVPLLVVLMFNKKISFYSSVKGFFYPIIATWLLFFTRIFPKLSNSIKVDSPNSEIIFIYIFIFLSIVVLSITLFILYSKNKKYPNDQEKEFIKSMKYSSIFVWVWFTTKFGSLYAWVYETSLGSVVSNYTREGINPYIQTIMALKTYGPAIFLSIISLSFIIYILSKYKINLITKNDKIISFILLSSTIIPIILYFTTVQVTYRKIAPTMTVILIFSLIKIIKNFDFKFLYMPFFIVLMGLQIYFIKDNIEIQNINSSWDNYSKNNFSRMILGNEFPRPVNIKPNPHDIVINFLINNQKKYKSNVISIVFNDTAKPVEAYLLRFLCEKKGLNCKVSLPKKFLFDDLSSYENSDAFLIINFKDIPLEIDEGIAKNLYEMIKSKKTRSIIQNASTSELYSYYLHYVYSSDNLNSINIKNVNCEKINNVYNVCYLSKK